MVRSRLARRKGKRRKTLKRKILGRIQYGGQDSPSLITIYILCFNEEKILEFTVNAYRNLFPKCKIVIYDNESTDSSVEKAKALNCEVRTFSTGGKMDELKLTEMRNTVWKDATTPWIIMCDMDEIVAANQNDLIEEDKKGVTILKMAGYEMYGKSEKNDLSNIKIESITSGEKSDLYSKTLCFRQDKIENMNFSPGAHKSNPVAKAGSEVKFSEKAYTLYHFKKLGKNYYQYTQTRATPRAVEMKKLDMLTHYTQDAKNNEEAVKTDNKALEVVPALSTHYMK
jgi:glycosyltransferase involved in cell wall biosynthesis